ncbi:fibrinogen alpha chain [Hippocampus comes]|uniref:fibrinogen alpha chain n=1 Tax=Hippocampus comes TaxID=109280 RepID=UPI00094E34E8|nr:PREDICTED: fibrinogen alpha chain-like [Hippocampus comes]
MLGSCVNRKLLVLGKQISCAGLHIQHGRQQPGLSHTGRRCPARSDVPPCSHGDWGRKCPSGCRLQAILSQAHTKVDRKLYGFCKTAKTLEAANDELMAKVANVYRQHRRVLVIQHVSELKFVQDAAELARNLTTLRQRSGRQRQRLEELKERVRRQVEELWRAEVDVDMKLRACAGSCKAVLPFSIDDAAYRTLRADATEFDSQRRKQAPPPGDIPQIKLRPVLVGPPPSKAYKQIPTVRSELLTQFEDIGQNQLFLVESENGEPHES